MNLLHSILMKIIAVWHEINSKDPPDNNVSVVSTCHLPPTLTHILHSGMREGLAESCINAFEK